ncbi:MAG: hypothetical protein GY862_18765 [Gammaproteobacteria bacterium]|nr:hypothetical protein [Gammaproteobacteria bacterium]
MLIWIGVNAKYLANAESNTKRERATELEYLTWWRQNADFGPGEMDVKIAMDRAFMDETGKNLPEGWNEYLADGDTSIDLP